jgi:hypothetical protein
MIDRDGSRSDEDSQLERLFAPLAREIDDAAFTAAVLRRVALRRRGGLIRTVVLGLAGAIGVAFALGPVTRLLASALPANGAMFLRVYRGLGSDGLRALDAAGPLDSRAFATLLAVLCVLCWPLIVRWLAR